MTPWRRAVLAVTTAALVCGTLSVTPAHADDYVPSTTATLARWGYVDRATPSRVHLDPEGDAPVGAGADRHLSRSYFTFDLTAFDGATVLSAALSGVETRAEDCTRRAVEVWRTDALTGDSSWIEPPRERELLATAGPVEGACPAPLAADLTAAVIAAVRRGDDTITLELRVPRKVEEDPSYGRAFANDPKLVVGHNRPPATPTAHQVWPNHGCVATAPGTYLNPDRLNDARRLLFMATLSDPDAGDVLTAEFAHWPVADPAARESLQWPARGDGTVTAQAGHWLFPQDGTHAWTVRALDGTASSPETAPCYFTIDRTAPTAPAVASQVYPSGWTQGGGYGVPGDFTFTTTSADVVAYEYSFQSGGGWISVAPATLGGPATITHTPTRTGGDGVSVRTVDRAGNRSSWSTYYSFSVAENRPSVRSTLYPAEYANPQGGVGVPGQFEFSSYLTDVASFTYRVDDGPETTGAADAARRAVVTHTPTHGGHHVLRVRSTSSAGVSSPEREHRFLVDTAPVVTLTGRAVIGSEVAVTFKPRQADVASYTYWFVRWSGAETERVTVPAAADGTGGFAWAPLVTDVGALWVRSTDAAGVASEARRTEVSVDGAAPQVRITGSTSQVHPATFTFSTSMASPVEYEYWFDHAPSVKHTVPASANGTATVQHTADRIGSLTLRTRVRNAAGTWSAEGSAGWWVHDNPDISSPDFTTWPDSPWREGSFTFTSNQLGATEFEYRIDDLVAVVPVGADGTATVRWTPTHTGQQYLKVTTRTASGAVSAYSTYQFRVFDHPDVTSEDFPGTWYPTPWREGSFTFTSNQLGATEFRYTAGGVTSTVPVGADGTATVRWTPTHTGRQSMVVSSRTAAGLESSPTTYWFTVHDLPTVTSAEYPEDYHFVPVGTPGTFTFASGRPGVVEYTYSFELDYEPGEEHTVAAAADGTASITWAPPAYGSYVLRVTAHMADGSTSFTREHDFTIWEPWA